MPARDDSVIRGSLIACVIFLVLSLVLNFLLWRWGNTSSLEASEANARLQSTSAEVRKQSDQLNLMKAMIGASEVTEAEFEQMRESAAGDEEMQQILTDYDTAMSYFGPDIDPSQKNFAALPEYLVNVIRERVTEYNRVSDLREQDVANAEAAAQNARDAQAMAEQRLAQLQEELEAKTAQFEQDRQAMKVANAQLQDLVTNQANQSRQKIDELTRQIADLQKQTETLLQTVDLQRRRINTLQNTGFEVAQGKVAYTRPGDRLVQINLGSADALRPGVTFGVFDSEQTQVTEATPKATIEVVALRGAHLADARIVSDPQVSNPIIPGDIVYSPFWAPGREVRIALAGAIDIDGDGRDDTPTVRGLIESAGAEVAATVNEGGEGGSQGKLDSGIRFLVVGERPELPAADAADAELTQRAEEEMARFGAALDEARQLGITVIPAYKLLGFLKTIDDSLTIPLGTSARASDFPPVPVSPGRRQPRDISGLYQNAPQRSN